MVGRDLVHTPDVRNITSPTAARAADAYSTASISRCRRGEYVAIVGESGVGQSSVLNLIAGLDMPDAGEILLEGRDLARLDEHARTRLPRAPQEGQNPGFL